MWNCIYFITIFHEMGVFFMRVKNLAVRVRKLVYTGVTSVIVVATNGCETTKNVSLQNQEVNLGSKFGFAIKLSSYYKNLDNLLAGKKEVVLDSLTIGTIIVSAKADSNTLKNTNSDFSSSTLQCTELVKRAYKDFYNLSVSGLNSSSPKVSVTVKEKGKNVIKSYALIKIEKASDIKAGYLVIQSDGSHSAIVKSISGTTLTLLEQNYTYDVVTKNKNGTTTTTNYISVGRNDVVFDNNKYKVFGTTY